jgi:hypothetical protein
MLSRRGFAFDKAFQTLQLLVEHPIDPRRPLLHAAADDGAIAARSQSSADSHQVKPGDDDYE